MTHKAEVEALQFRQLALLKSMPVEDALLIMAQAPCTHDVALETIGDFLQRRTLGRYIMSQLTNNHNGDGHG